MNITAASLITQFIDLLEENCENNLARLTYHYTNHWLWLWSSVMDSVNAAVIIIVAWIWGCSIVNDIIMKFLNTDNSPHWCLCSGFFYINCLILSTYLRLSLSFYFFFTAVCPPCLHPYESLTDIHPGSELLSHGRGSAASCSLQTRFNGEPELWFSRDAHIHYCV